MPTILGIDPGSCITGYGVIKLENNKTCYLSSGCIRTSGKEPAQKLKQIFDGICEIIAKYPICEVAIEKAFMYRNAVSALKLGEVRGTAISAISQYNLTISQYSPRQVKKSVTGYGAADKQQIQHMITKLLKLDKTPPVDAADALAIALCHCYLRANKF